MTTAQYMEEKQSILAILLETENKIPLDSILKILKKLETAAVEKAADTEAKAGAVEIRLEENIDQINHDYQKIKETEQARGNLEIAYAKLCEQLKQGEVALRNLETVLNHLRSQLEEAYNRERKAEQELKKWCWVPGYGIYLLVECQKAIDKINQQIKDQAGEKKTIYQEIDQLQKEKSQLDNDCWLNRQQIKQLNEKIAASTKEQKILLEQQKQFRENLLQWQTQTLYFRLLQDKLEGFQSMAEITGEISEEIKQIVSQGPELYLLQ